MNEINYPYVRVQGTKMEGLLYINRDGSRDIFDGVKWWPVPHYSTTEPCKIKKGCIRQMIEYVKHVECEDDRYFFITDSPIMDV